MMHDYKTGTTHTTNRSIILPPLRWIILLAAVLVPVSMIALLPDEAGASRSTGAVNLEPVPATLIADHINNAVAVEQDISGYTPLPAATTPSRTHTLLIRPGDSLARLFSRLGLGARKLQEIMQLGPETEVLARLIPGQRLQIHTDEQHRILDLVYEVDARKSLHISRRGGAFFASTMQRAPETRTARSAGTIRSSLFEAGQKAGLSDKLIMELVGVFGWDIDFALDIRSGDRFSLLYEERYLDGSKLGSGNILAAEFTNAGKTYRAVRYTDPNGRTDYYTPDGRSMRKAFLRTPVAFSRISSRFGRRNHPVLNRMRAHKGVDYAAERSTPVKATGNGKIVHVGRKGGYGKTVIIRHGGKYSTLYAHLSRYKRGLRKGNRVKQGEIVGYVGSTGLATGPHLHYEFRIHGVHRNPLKVRLPDAKPLERKYRQDFSVQAGDLLAQLNRSSATDIAFNKSP